jgi:hypothetical protein
MELRHDRVYQTLTQAVLNDIRNLAVMGGDASKLLPLLLSQNTIKVSNCCAYINLLSLLLSHNTINNR